jgi:hypothetical protein
VHFKEAKQEKQEKERKVERNQERVKKQRRPNAADIAQFIAEDTPAKQHPLHNIIVSYFQNIPFIDGK